ncbi:GapS1 family protein [Escherichia coli]|uniref:GapS1 family protein n=1 Tax=Escherichia coli TaxID=562 RepID=UPI000B7DBC12|nr:hypothetical protein [Escherichia coli]EEK2882924.1 hypothetical protein [Salmonella enterica]EEK3632256.1 hypothetical protein [Salmonella enterica]EEK3790578.1 hypothetical protein [Salmonella enterica]EEK3894342.1 hypothetical protein [Salmonella enterica]EEK4033030.1 hypothetical protein [Salmonella enterica]
MIKNIDIQSDAVAKLRMDSIRSEIQSYNPELFIEFCMQYNLQKFDDNLHMLRHMPWIVNLCLKWSASVIGKNRKFKTLTKNQAIKLFQKAYETLSIIPIGLEKKNGVHFFLRNNLYQQGIYQKIDAINSISRQVFLFSQLENTHKIKTSFFKLTNISIDDFLKLSYILISLITTEHPVRKINVNSFSVLFPILPKDTVENFLDAISINYSELSKFSKSKTFEKPLLEYYSSSPYLENPLIKKGSDYFQIHAQLTSRSIQTFIYDLLRRTDAEKFMDSFGTVFERALGKIIQESNIPVITEDHLKEKLPKDNKVVDFLFPHANANIFIDAKGVEIHQKGMVTLRPEDISGKIKKSVLKAIEQAHEVNREIYLDDKATITPFRKESFVICITYKNLFLGNGTFLASTYAETEMLKIYDKFNTDYHIPKENIFCLAFDEFEYLVASCKNAHVPPHMVLQYAVEKNKEPSSAAFLFSQHIESYFDRVINSDVVNEMGIKMVDSVLEKISQNEN